MSSVLSDDEISSLLSGLDDMDDIVNEPIKKTTKRKPIEKKKTAPVFADYNPSLSETKVSMSELNIRPEHDFICGHCDEKMDLVMFTRGKGGTRRWLLYCGTDKYYLDYNKTVERKKSYEQKIDRKRKRSNM